MYVECAKVILKIFYLFTFIQVIAQGIATLLKLGTKLSDDKILMMRLVGVARDNLKDTSHQVKCKCLQLISELYPIYPESDRTVEMTAEADTIVKLLGDYSNAEVHEIYTFYIRYHLSNTFIKYLYLSH